jgi:hypothetical protein
VKRLSIGVMLSVPSSIGVTDIRAYAPAKSKHRCPAWRLAHRCPRSGLAADPRPALRRTVECADVWFPSMALPAEVAAGARRPGELATERRRPSSPGIAVGGAVQLGARASPELDLQNFVDALTRG